HSALVSLLLYLQLLRRPNSLLQMVVGKDGNGHGVEYSSRYRSDFSSRPGQSSARAACTTEDPWLQLSVRVFGHPLSAHNARYHSSHCSRKSVYAVIHHHGLSVTAVNDLADADNDWGEACEIPNRALHCDEPCLEDIWRRNTASGFHTT